MTLPPSMDPEILVKAVTAVKTEAHRRGFGKGKGGHGHMPCPVPNCRGRVAFIVYTGNGHMMASCNRGQCLNVRE